MKRTKKKVRKKATKKKVARRKKKAPRLRDIDNERAALDLLDDRLIALSTKLGEHLIDVQTVLEQAACAIEDEIDTLRDEVYERADDLADKENDRSEGK